MKYWYIDGDGGNAKYPSLKELRWSLEMLNDIDKESLNHLDAVRYDSSSGSVLAVRMIYFDKKKRPHFKRQ